MLSGMNLTDTADCFEDVAHSAHHKLTLNFTGFYQWPNGQIFGWILLFLIIKKYQQELQKK